MFLQILFFVAILALLGVLVRQAREQYFPVIALAVLIVVLPLNRLLNDWGIGIISVLMLMFFIFNKSRQFTWQPIFYVTFGVYILYIVGMLYIGDFRLAGTGMDSMLPIVIFPVFFSMIQLSKRNVILILRFFLWIVIAACAYGLLLYAIAIYDFSWRSALLDGKRYVYFFMREPLTWHPSALAITLLMALPVSLYLRYHDGKQITLVEMLLAILLPILVTFMVGARIGVAVFPLLLGLSYLFYCKFRPILKWGLLVAGAVAMVVAAFSLSSDIRERFSDQIRIDLRNTAISAIKERPILGWGTGQERQLIACEERAQNLGLKGVHNQPHFHNVYLDMMVQFGIVGVAVLLFLIGWVFWIAIRKKHFLLMSFMAMYVIVFYFDNVLQSQRFVVAFMFWFCFLIANKRYLVERTSTEDYGTS